MPNPFAQALLFFRGGADGDEAPIRVIQGPKTLLTYPTDNLVLDGVHREVFVAQSFTNSVFVFRSDVGGDVAPIRIIRGPKTMLDRPIHVGVDPVNNLIAVTSNTGLWIFNRTDNGDVAPKWIIAAPNTGWESTNTLEPCCYLLKERRSSREGRSPWQARIGLSSECGSTAITGT